MNYKFVIYDENGLVVSYGETNTPLENLSTDLGTVESVEDFSGHIESVDTESPVAPTQPK